MKLTDIDHEPDGRVHIRFGKHGIEFSSVDACADWVAQTLGGEEVQRAILLRRALKATGGTLKPVKACRGFKVAVDLDADNPVAIAKDAS